MPGFTPKEGREFDAWLTKEPDEGFEFICPKSCEFPEHHHHLEYCPEQIATALSYTMSECPNWLESYDIQALWEEIHTCCSEGGKAGYALADLVENGSYPEAEYLLALRRSKA